jgi:uncharacterized protein (UPF0147 family)
MQANDIIKMMDDFCADSSVPKNVRLAVEEARKRMRDNSLELTLRVSDSIYRIEKVTEDPNLQPHARMGLWNVLSALESVKKK